MRVLLCWTILGCIAVGQSVHVSGQVVDLTGAPVAKATVIFLGAEAYTQTTGKNGEFALDAAPGVYAIVAAHAGFVFQKYGAHDALASFCPRIAALRVTAERGSVEPRALSDQKDCIRQAPGLMLTLEAGKDVKGLKISLTPVGVVSGTVTDEEGDPVAGWEVRLWQIGYDRFGHRTLVGRPGTQSRDDGVFRIAGVTPGRYYLSAGIPSQDDGRLRVSRPPRSDLFKTYYPSELDVSRSAMLEVTSGAELRGMDIRLRKTQLYSISGSVVPDPQAGDVAGQNLRIMGADSFGNLTQMSLFIVRPDNSWQFRGLPAGEYLIVGGGGDNPQRCIRRKLSVTDADLNGVALAMDACPQLSGTVKFEDGPAAMPASLTFTHSELGIIQSAELHADGSFRTPHLAESTYFLDIPALPPNAYVKSARWGGQDVLHSPLDATTGAKGTLEIVVSLRGATVAAVVRNDRGDPMSGVTVTIWQPASQAGVGTGGIKTAQTDQKGTVTISGLAPGQYFAAAWEGPSIEPGLLQSPAFLGRFQDVAAGVAVVEDSTLSVALKLVSGERISSEISKLT